ncbi:MAG: hypothetical protein ACRBBJ_04130 [Rhodomicrobiaceae bacterium]|jgi:hypothetical protein
MNFKPTLILFLCLFFLSIPAVFSQVKYQVRKPSSHQINQGQIKQLPSHKYLDSRCTDYYSRPVLHVRNDSLSDVAFSDLMRHRGVAMGPMTILNIRRLSKLSKASQLFFIAHECGHHVLGHLYFRLPGQTAEQEADCYAIRSLIRSGMFTLKDVADVQTDMRKYAQASRMHISGDERAIALIGCME